VEIPRSYIQLEGALEIRHGKFANFTAQGSDGVGVEERPSIEFIEVEPSYEVIHIEIPETPLPEVIEQEPEPIIKAVHEEISATVQETEPTEPEVIKGPEEEPEMAVIPEPPVVEDEPQAEMPMDIQKPPEPEVLYKVIYVEVPKPYPFEEQIELLRQDIANLASHVESSHAAIIESIREVQRDVNTSIWRRLYKWIMEQFQR